MKFTILINLNLQKWLQKIGLLTIRLFHRQEQMLSLCFSILELRVFRKIGKKLNFKKIDIFQPPILIRHLDLMRSVEKSGIKFLNSFNKSRIIKISKAFKGGRFS